MIRVRELITCVHRVAGENYWIHYWITMFIIPIRSFNIQHIGVGAGQVGLVLTGPLFRKKLVGITIITINTCVLVRAAAACSASG